MKLQSNINNRFLALTFMVFSVAGVLFYFVLERVVDQNIYEMLKSRKAYILLHLLKNPQSIDSMESFDHSVFIRRVGKVNEYQYFVDTLAYDQQEKELIPYRKMTFSAHSGENYFNVVILQSLFESEDLQMAIFSFMALLFCLVLLALFFLNRWLSSKIWTPFFQSLSVLNAWKMSENKTFNFDPTGISEFDQLNDTLEKMMHKFQTDFINMKEFTENASHEIQTPLAIIKSKLELVLHDQTLNDQQHNRVHAAFESAIRLSKLNEALLLLSKIENKQFVQLSEIDLCQVIQSKVEYLEELFALKQIDVSVHLNEKVILTMNPMLAEILIGNLLSNALRHNFEKGKIIISSQNQQITISNTGEKAQMDVTRLFRRFAKQVTSNESNGLGLAIANEICKNYHLQLSYSYLNEMHQMILVGED